MSHSPDMSLAHLVDSVPAIQSQDVLKKFHWAIKRVVNEHGTDSKEATLTEDELIQLIRVWEPQRDIICLYVRWARQLRRNFNLDSIATLLCLSRQCGYTPVDFLRKVKTLSIHKNQKSVYGVTFSFNTPNRKDVDRERLSKEFLGLSVTLSLLQEQVTVSASVLGKTGMRQSGPRTALPIDIPIDSKNRQHASVATHPNVEFHTQSSLVSRIWTSINHRWLVLYLIEHLFREVNVPWSYDDALVRSFQMMAPSGPGRYEFLSPLAGYCLRFVTPESIESKRNQLREIWSNPSLFLSYGNSCLTQFTTEAKSRLIITCFQELRANFGPTCNQISYNRDCSMLRRLTILRAYLFHFWLDSASNSSIKSIVADGTYTSSKKKRKFDQCQQTRPTAPGKSVSTSPIASPIQQVPQKRSKSGLQSITSSRRISTPKTPCTSNDLPPRPTVNVDGKIGNHKSNNPHPTNISVENPGRNITNIMDIDWTSLRLVATEEMKRFVQSYLLIHRLDGINVLSELSPLEVYSADHLHDLTHCRLSGKFPFFPDANRVGPVVLHIRTEADQFLDTSAKSFHVAREQSEYFKEHSQHLPSLHQIQSLCKAIVRHGNNDCKRADGQYRVNIGNGGQNWVNGAPCQLHGLRFQKDLDNDSNFNATEVLETIGQIAEFTWLVTCALQTDAKDHAIAPDRIRKQLYASCLSKYLYMDEEVGFEDLTMVVSLLNPVTHEVLPHKDVMNDTLAGYTRTAAFNMVMIDENDDDPTIVHFQVICNFRKVIGSSVAPFHKHLSPVAKHARLYMDKWHRSIQSVYAGKTQKIPSVYDRSTFFLDDTLEYNVVAISEEGKHKQTIASDYILTEVNISRTLSLSMFIDPIVKLQHYLKFDQTIELALVCSFLSNPFWFNWTMSTLIRQLEDPNKKYRLGLHPFYDWCHNTIEIFGTWQGGPYNRWSPCGGNQETVLETFGAQPNATTQEIARGERRLSQVVSILHKHIDWINSLADCGSRPIMDMPLASMKAQCQNTINEIAKAASCQFSHFRLGIFTTIMSGCGLLREGKHLRHLMYPVKGSASFKHLYCPDADFMSEERARALGQNVSGVVISNDGEGFVHEEHHDTFMQYLSAELGFKTYLRDEMECILCESHPMRSLNCRDWFHKGMSVYDCNEEGEFFRRDYGSNTTWVKLHPPQQYEFAYLQPPAESPIKYIPLDIDVIATSSDKILLISFTDRL